MIPFFIVQIIVLIILFVFLHPTKRQPFEVVGKQTLFMDRLIGGRIRNKRTKNVHLIPENQ